MRTRRVLAFLSASLVLLGCGGAPHGIAASTAAPATAAPEEHPAIAALGPESRDALRRSPVAMLVLPMPYASRTTVMVGEAWCALSYRDDEISVSLHATRASEPAGGGAVLERPPPSSVVRGRPAFESVEEGIRGVSWSEGEVVYALDIECARPLEDPRCTERELSISLANDLVPVALDPAR